MPFKDKRGTLELPWMQDAGQHRETQRDGCCLGQPSCSYNPPFVVCLRDPLPSVARASLGPVYRETHLYPKTSAKKRSYLPFAAPHSADQRLIVHRLRKRNFLFFTTKKYLGLLILLQCKTTYLTFESLYKKGSGIRKLNEPSLPSLK